MGKQILIALCIGLVGAAGYTMAKPTWRYLSAEQVSDVMNRPDKFDDRVISVRGMVVGMPVAVIGIGGFRLSQPGTNAELVVISRSGVPRRGEVLTVTGRFEQLAAFNDKQFGFIFQGAEEKERGKKTLLPTVSKVVLLHALGLL